VRNRSEKESVAMRMAHGELAPNKLRMHFWESLYWEFTLRIAVVTGGRIYSRTCEGVLKYNLGIGDKQYGE